MTLHPLVAAFAIALLISAGSSPSPPTTDGAAPFDARADIELRASDGTQLTLDAYVPSGPGTHPAVILVHGGSWTGGDKTDFATLGATLTEFDWVAIAVNYRLGVEMIDQQVEDVLTTVRWAADHAGELHIDASRIAVLGASAGGHLAALAATREGSARPTRVDAVVAWSGIFDLAALAPKGGRAAEDCNALCQQTFGSGVLEGVVGCSYDECPSRYADASPVNHVGPAAPPMLLAGSDGDAVSPSQARKMAGALRGAGVPAETQIVGTAAHGYELGPDVLDATTGFLQQQLEPSEDVADADGGAPATVAGVVAVIAVAISVIWFWKFRRRREAGSYR